MVGSIFCFLIGQGWKRTLTGISTTSCRSVILNFMILIFMGKRTCVKKVHVQRRHETTIQNLPLNVYHFLDFVITDSWESFATWPLKVSWCRSYASNDIFIIILAAVSEGHRLDVFLVPPLVHVNRFLV